MPLATGPRSLDAPTVPEPSWWNMAIPIIIVVAGVTFGFLGVM